MAKDKEPVKAVERGPGGEIQFNLDADAANVDWIRAGRLKEAGKHEELQELFDTSVYEYSVEEIEEREK